MWVLDQPFRMSSWVFGPRPSSDFLSYSFDGILTSTFLEPQFLYLGKRGQCQGSCLLHWLRRDCKCMWRDGWFVTLQCCQNVGGP